MVWGMPAQWERLFSPLSPLSSRQEGSNKVLNVTQKKFCANGCIDGESPTTFDL